MLEDQTPLGSLDQFPGRHAAEEELVGVTDETTAAAIFERHGVDPKTAATLAARHCAADRSASSDNA